VINSKSAAAGYAFSQVIDGETIVNRSPSWTTGTIVECNIFTVPNRTKAPEKAEVMSPLPLAATGSDSHLVCITATFKASEGIAPEDLGKIRGTLEQSHRPTDGLIIAVDLPTGLNTPSDTELRQAIHDIYQQTVTVANPTAVALVFAGANRKLLTLAITDFNSQNDALTATNEFGFDRPILVVVPENLHYWAGGTPAFRHVLSQLSQGRSPLRLQEFDDIVPKRQARQQLSSQVGLISLKDDILTLNLRPEDVIFTLATHIRREIEHAVQIGEGRGVKRGAFLTSNLRLTSRWANVPELLVALKCERLAGFLMGSLVGARVGFFVDKHQPPAVIRIGSVPDDLTSVFAMSLTGVTNYYDGTSSLPFDLISGERPREVVLCTEQISTGRSIDRAIHELAEHGISTVAVATVIDSLAVGHGADGDHIEAGRSTVPLVKLAKVAIDLPDRPAKLAGVTAIDPVTGLPLPERRLYAKTSADQYAYIKTIGQTQAARLGHIARPAQRHYTAYVDQTILFWDLGWSRRATQQIARRLKETVPRGDGIRPVAILFPSGTSNYLDDVAQRVSSALETGGISVAGIRKVARAVEGREWVFPPSIDLPPNAGHVLILDAGMGSGHSLLQLIRLAATKGVDGITAVILADGLNERDAIALQQVRSVASTEDLAERPEQRGPEIPVRIHFLNRTAVGGINATECPVCIMRSSYSGLPPPASEILVAQQRLVVRALEPRTKNSAFGGAASDLFGMPISQSDCISYLQWRSRLRDAVFSPTERDKVVESLDVLAAASATDERASEMVGERDGFIRLIVAEGQWLGKAPLYFSEVRDKIADITHQILSSGPASASDAMLRLQAAIALSKAAPHRFADALEEIVRESLDHSFVISQVLLETYRLIESELTPDAVLKALAQGLNGLEQVAQLIARTTPSGSGVDIASDIRYLGSLVRRRLNTGPDDPQSAWALLLRHLTSVREHKYDQTVWRLRVHLDGLALGLVPNDPEMVIDDWFRCSDSLATEVLPNLQPLGRILLSKRIIDPLPGRDEERWAQVVRGRWPELLDDITMRLRKVFVGSGGVFNRRGEGELLLDDIEWWNRFFFSAPSHEDRPLRDAVLVDLLKRCPASIHDVVEHAFVGSDHMMKYVDISDPHSVRVFCTSSLLSDALSHIRLNAEVKHRIPGTAQAFMISVSEVGAHSVKITVRNSASQARGSAEGRGLAVHRGELARFGGDLATVAVDPPWTYGVSLTLERWRMAR
jgi:hypothetical protein